MAAQNPSLSRKTFSPFNWLIEPVGQLSGEDRRNARLLSGLLFAILLALMGNLIFADRKLFAAAGAVAAAYLISRTRYYFVAGIIAIAFMSFIVFPFGGSGGEYSVDRISHLMAWSLLPVLVASMIFPLRWVVVVII